MLVHSDNLKFGVQFSRKFVDAPEKSKTWENKNVRSLMNLHNNEAGRQVINSSYEIKTLLSVILSLRKTTINLKYCQLYKVFFALCFLSKAVAHLMRMQCRCHGVSGSCELKTCWKNVPTFSQVGDYLKKKYQKSVQVSKVAVATNEMIVTNFNFNISEHVHKFVCSTGSCKTTETFAKEKWQKVSRWERGTCTHSKITRLLRNRL